MKHILEHRISMKPINVSDQWMQHIKQSITCPEDLGCALGVDGEKLKPVSDRYPMRLNAYYMRLIREAGDPIWRQAVPDVRELDETGLEDPLAEEKDSPVPGIAHRYPDRVLFYVTHMCAVYCRFCTRKRKVADPHSVSDGQIQRGLEYIRSHPEVRDVIVSGGDPLMLPDEKLDAILRALRVIPHVQIIRIGTRMPVTLPQRITPVLCDILKRYHPIFVNTHFNHPREVTEESAHACNMLADAGIPLGNQSVLLRGVNNDPEVMKALVHKLLAIRVRPYYIYLMDLVKGGEHFRTSLSEGLDIIKALRGHTSGLAVPTLVCDAPGGGGKIPLSPDVVVSQDDEKIVLRNFEGKHFTYPAHPSE